MDGLPHRGFGFAFGFPRKNGASLIVVTPPVIVPGSVLKSLTLSSNTVVEGSPAGTLIGAITNTSPGSTLTLPVNAGGRFTIDGANNLVTGSVLTDFDTIPQHSITVTETLAGDLGSPKSTNFLIDVTNVLEVTLNTLSGAFSLPENAAAGASAGNIAGTAVGSSLSLVGDAGGRIALIGTQVVRGASLLDFETASVVNFTVREIHPDASNSPKDSPLSLAVTNIYEQPTLQNLALSLSSFTIGASVSGSIDNATPASAIVSSGTLPTGFSFNGTGRTWSYNGTGSASSGTFNFIETLADSSNSSHTSTINWSIAAVGTFATPVLSLFSAPNTVPVTFSVTDTDYVAGWYGQLQIATDSGFTAVTQDSGAVFIGGAEWAALDAVFPFNDPTGTYYARFRFLRENPSGATTVASVSGAIANYDATSWSNTITDTITISVAKFVSATGTGKSRWITTTASDFEAYFNANVGIAAGAKLTVPASFDKWHLEFELTNWNAISGSLRVGITDPATDFNAGTGAFGGSGSAALPGGAGSPGFSIIVAKGATSFTFNGAGGGTVTLPGGIVTDVKDRIIMEGTTSTGVVNFYYWDDSAVALVSGGASIATKTMSGAGLPSSPTGWAGGIKGAGGSPGTSDAVTVFPVHDKKALSAGFNDYG